MSESRDRAFTRDRESHDPRCSTRYRATPKSCPTRAGRLKAALRPVRPPAPAPPGAPTPIRRRRRRIVRPRQTFLLETISKGVSAGVKTVPGARRLVLAAEFLGGDAGGEAEGQCDDHPCEPQPPPRHRGASFGPST